MKTQVYRLDGSTAHEIELADAVFNREPSEGSIYHAIRNELANRRVGTASTKTRAEVHGSNKKPWKQKGTGRARSGDRKSPVWVGGGKIFGPKPRDYSYVLPRKVKRLAVASILSLKNQGDALRVVEDFSVPSGRTKDFVAAVAKIAAGGERTVIVLAGEDALIRRAGRNLPWLTFLAWNRLAAHDLFYARQLVVLEGAVGKLNALLGGEGTEGAA